MTRQTYCIFEAALGPCGVAWSEGKNAAPAVTAFQLPEATAAATEQRIAREAQAAPAPPPPSIAALIDRARRHLAGEPQDFLDVPLDLAGVPLFARRVYDAAREIPPGKTRTYGELASAIDHPGAARAVGQALGRNPIPLIIPCHRILAAGGKPGGFSAHGGWATKKKMLALEGAPCALPPNVWSPLELKRAAAALKARDPRLARCMAKPLVNSYGTGGAAYERLFEAIVSQQLASKAAAAILNKVKALFPEKAIPAPEDLLAAPDETLRAAGLSKGKTASLKDLAAKTLTGVLPSAGLLAALDDEEIIQRLTTIYGVGRWTVEMLLIFNLGRPDVFPAGDYALRKAVAALYEMEAIPTPKELQALSENWRPFRTTASLYLWSHIDSAQNGAAASQELAIN